MRPLATTDSKSPGLHEKAPIYEALSALNQHFEQVLVDLQRLKTLGVFRSRFQRESLAACGAAIEESRSWINVEATETLHDREERDQAYFGRIRHGFEKKYEDPQDVLLRAQRLNKKIAPAAKKKG